MDFAASKVCLKASGVEMSGFGAPSRTPTPIPVRAMSVRVPGVTAPCRAISSMAISVMISTSAASPAVSFWRMTPTVPNVNVAVCPVSCRNAAARSVTIARTAPALSTLISAACARSMPGHRAIAIRKEPNHAAPLVVATLIVRLLAHRAGRVRCPLPERLRCQALRRFDLQFGHALQLAESDPTTGREPLDKAPLRADCSRLKRLAWHPTVSWQDKKEGGTRCTDIYVPYR